MSLAYYFFTYILCQFTIINQGCTKINSIIVTWNKKKREKLIKIVMWKLNLSFSLFN